MIKPDMHCRHWETEARKIKTDIGYAIMVEPLTEADGGGWLATVPALPGCMADGDPPEVALADAESAIAEWLAAANVLAEHAGRVA